MTGPTPRAAASTGGVPAVDVDLWSIGVRGITENALDLSELDAEELGRFEGLRRAQDRVLFGAAHVALRRLLAGRLGMAPAEVGYLREPCPCCGAPHGRPAVLGRTGAPHFSLSHGGDMVLIGMASRPVGVDVEAVPTAADVRDLISALHPLERGEIADDAFSPETFARIWTRKEAYLKGLGTGLGRALDADYLGETGRAPSPRGWCVSNVPVDGLHAAAVAVEGPEMTLRVTSLPARFVCSPSTSSSAAPSLSPRDGS
ncbi:4'-phosphopantetheinyl transferase family protein [Streptomyces sp. c-19]|uniref:4'-phosphopantetheinyl transferase family protein n=1 Tax=Streptomyces sp. c-19 TaxID=2789275 RepID=UPI00398190BE